MKTYLLTLLLTLTLTYSYSQEPVVETKVNTLETQFDDINRKSTNYQIYKVISKESYQGLKLNVLDSVKSLKEIISEKQIALNTEKNNIETTKNLLTKTKSELDIALEKDNSISLFGMLLSKTTYNLILWSIILALLLALSYFIFKFLRSNILTKQAQNSLNEVEQEFELHRKKTLEKEQKLRRQLQDEINKQRNS
jgi:hypothetical protein